MSAAMMGYAESGLTTAKFVRHRKSDGAWWNTSGTPGFQVFSAGSIADYGIAATEVGSTGVYTATDPAEGTEGDFLLVKAAGASLAVADLIGGARWQDIAGGASVTTGGITTTSFAAGAINAAAIATDAFGALELAAGAASEISTAVVTALSAGVTLTNAYDLYHADIHFTRDETNSQDEYELTWFKNGVRQTSGITVPTIQVIKRADGADLIASTTPTQIGSTGSYKYDATGANRLTRGQAALVVVTATIDSATRTFSRMIGRDS